MVEDKIKSFVQHIHDVEYVKQQIQSISEISLRNGPQQGLTTLVNMGNTCYMNAVIQCLRHSTDFNLDRLEGVMLKNLDANEKLGPGILLFMNYIKLASLMWQHDKAQLTPICFRILLAEVAPQFANCMQHDAHELLVTLLQLFHDVLSKNVKYQINGEPMTALDIELSKAHQDWINYYKNRRSIILDTFCGQLRTEMVCLNCRTPSSKYDPILCLDLPLVPNSDLMTCLSQFVATEQLTPDNLYLCEHCHIKTCAYKRSTLWTLPETLIIKLNRFQHRSIGGTYVLEKIVDCVNYPVQGLNLQLFVSSPLVNQPFYDLQAIVCHAGDLNYGHYYAICRDEARQTWTRYNDEKCDSIEQPVISDAYILFYKKRE